MLEPPGSVKTDVPASSLPVERHHTGWNALRRSQTKQLLEETDVNVENICLFFPLLSSRSLKRNDTRKADQRLRGSRVDAADNRRVRPLTAEASGCCRVAAEGVFRRDGWQARFPHNDSQ